MSVNTMDFNQISTVLNDIHEQVTGQKQIAPTNTSEFVSVATTVLQNGYEPLLNAITQLVNKTIFSIRPYEAKFKGLQVDNQKFGSITRKLHIADKDFENDISFELVDGQSVDHYKVNKPDVLQTNFYGQNVFTKKITIFKDQLDSAFTGPEQLAEFMSMITQNASDMIEQAHENLARATVANFIGGKVAMADDGGIGDASGVVHLLTEYNALTGLNLTAQTVYQPANFKPFMQWVFSKLEDLSSRMTERTMLFQRNIVKNGQVKKIMHHTPRDRQKVLLYAPAKAQIEAQVLADTYHENYLKLADNEAVNFWQNFEDPLKISVTPVYPKADGTLETGKAAEVDKIFGLIYDDEAMGYTVVNTWSATTPLNVDGGYWNTAFHFTDRYWNDFLEKGVVLLLD